MIRKHVVYDLKTRSLRDAGILFARYSFVKTNIFVLICRKVDVSLHGFK